MVISSQLMLIPAHDSAKCMNLASGMIFVDSGIVFVGDDVELQLEREKASSLEMVSTLPTILEVCYDFLLLIAMDYDIVVMFLLNFGGLQVIAPPIAGFVSMPFDDALYLSTACYSYGWFVMLLGYKLMETSRFFEQYSSLVILNSFIKLILDSSHSRQIRSLKFSWLLKKRTTCDSFLYNPVYEGESCTAYSFPEEPILNSASVVGGAPSAPAHFNLPPQSPVVHFSEPEASKLQPVRPQNRPDQPGETVKLTEDPEGKANPPSPISLDFAVRIPGQTVKLQRFDKVKTVPETMEIVP
ncbi:unnamed protein product [Arabidopsis lyrata]|nr:unnamed protein product [Arabidopsis lyrata]